MFLVHQGGMVVVLAAFINLHSLSLLLLTTLLHLLNICSFVLLIFPKLSCSLSSIVLPKVLRLNFFQTFLSCWKKFHPLPLSLSLWVTLISILTTYLILLLLPFCH